MGESETLVSEREGRKLRRLRWFLPSLCSGRSTEHFSHKESFYSIPACSIRCEEAAVRESTLYKNSTRSMPYSVTRDVTRLL